MNTQKQLYDHQAERTKLWPKPVEIIGTTALEAMLLEAACAPAPGLVDRYNSGAHDDMDIFTFIKSSSALGPAMYRCAMAGWEHKGCSAGLLPVLRYIGCEAEQTMLAATDGVNTQKGLLFLLGVITAAAALAIQNQSGQPVLEQTVTQAAGICQGMVERELAVLKRQLPNRKLTAGERLYLQYGVTGVRGEIEAGLPVVQTKGLPYFREALANELPLNDALVHSLVGLMTATEDTTILNRHDMTTLLDVQQQAQQIMNLGGMLSQAGRTAIQQLDDTFSNNRISPGGAADLLAVTYFLYAIEKRL